jgi:uncharacterized membrane protein YbjE (DUF340 family)
MVDEQSKKIGAMELARTGKDFGMLATEMAQTGKGFVASLSLDNNKEVVQLSLTLIVVEVAAEERGGTVYLSFDAGSFRAVQVDRPESNSRRVQYLTVVVIGSFSGPLCSSLENHVMEAEMIGLLVLLVVA